MTDRCNLRCRYCEGHFSGRQIKDLTMDEIRKIIDECKELGACHFIIHGGEILLRNDIGKIVDYLKEKDLYVDLATNGALLPDKINEIKNVDSLCISLDGREENNDFTRGKGSYLAAMRAIEAARAEGIKLSVHATLTKINLGDIEYLCEQARRMGYYQQFSLLLKPLRQFQNELVLNDEEIRTVLRQIIGFKRKGYPV
ncbi:MAG: radical SAM protein, partial [Candidatus Omnitrophota bacterium]